MGLDSDARLPDWCDEGTDSSLRDVEEEYPAVPITMSGIRSPNVAVSSASGFGSSNVSSGTTPPVVLTPMGVSPKLDQGVSNKIGAWTDLDKFYEDTESEESSDGEEEGEESEEDPHPSSKPLGHGEGAAPEGEESSDSGESIESEESEESSD